MPQVTGRIVAAGPFKVADADEINVDTTGFDGNLGSTDDDLQKVAQKVDDLVLGSGGSLTESGLFGILENAAFTVHDEARFRTDINAEEAHAELGGYWAFGSAVITIGQATNGADTQNGYDQRTGTANKFGTVASGSLNVTAADTARTVRTVMQDDTDGDIVLVIDNESAQTEFANSILQIETGGMTRRFNLGTPFFRTAGSGVTEWEWRAQPDFIPANGSMTVSFLQSSAPFTPADETKLDGLLASRVTSESTLPSAADTPNNAIDNREGALFRKTSTGDAHTTNFAVGTDPGDSDTRGFNDLDAGTQNDFGVSLDGAAGPRVQWKTSGVFGADNDTVQVFAPRSVMATKHTGTLYAILQDVNNGYRQSLSLTGSAGLDSLDTDYWGFQGTDRITADHVNVGDHVRIAFYSDSEHTTEVAVRAASAWSPLIHDVHDNSTITGSGDIHDPWRVAVPFTAGEKQTALVDNHVSDAALSVTGGQLSLTLSFAGHSEPNVTTSVAWPGAGTDNITVTRVGSYTGTVTALHLFDTGIAIPADDALLIIDSTQSGGETFTSAITSGELRALGAREAPNLIAFNQPNLIAKGIWGHVVHFGRNAANNIVFAAQDAGAWTLNVDRIEAPAPVVEPLPDANHGALFTTQPSVTCGATSDAWGEWTEIYRYPHAQAEAKKFLFGFYVSAEASWAPSGGGDRGGVQYRCYTFPAAAAGGTTFTAVSSGTPPVAGPPATATRNVAFTVLNGHTYQFNPGTGDDPNKPYVLADGSIRLYPGTGTWNADPDDVAGCVLRVSIAGGAAVDHALAGATREGTGRGYLSLSAGFAYVTGNTVQADVHVPKDTHFDLLGGYVRNGHDAGGNPPNSFINLSAEDSREWVVVADMEQNDYVVIEARGACQLAGVGKAIVFPPSENYYFRQELHAVGGGGASQTADEMVALWRADADTNASATNRGIVNFADIDARTGSFARANSPTGRIPLAQTRTVYIDQAGFDALVAASTLETDVEYHVAG